MVFVCEPSGGSTDPAEHHAAVPVLAAAAAAAAAAAGTGAGGTALPGAACAVSGM